MFTFIFKYLGLARLFGVGDSKQNPLGVLHGYTRYVNRF